MTRIVAILCLNAHVRLNLLDGKNLSSDEIVLVGASSAWVWVAGGGATWLMTLSLEDLRNFLHKHGDIYIGDILIVPNEGIRDLALILEWKGGSYTDEVLYVLGLGYPVLFVKELCTLGLLMEFSKDHFWV